MTHIDVSTQTSPDAPSPSEPRIVNLAVDSFHQEAVLKVGPMWRAGPQCGRTIASFLRDAARTRGANLPTTQGGRS